MPGIGITKMNEGSPALRSAQSRGEAMDENDSSWADVAKCREGGTKEFLGEQKGS